MFWFLPPTGKCEWPNLREFIRQYNERFGVHYSLAKCLDVSDSTKPQPEILLKCPDEINIVIERKTLVFPPGYPESCRIEEEFCDYLRSRVNPAFQDMPFVLEVSINYLHGSKQYRRGMAQQIADRILQNIDYIKIAGTSTSQKPIPWSLKRLSGSELEDYGDKINGKGIVILISENWRLELPNEMQIRSTGKGIVNELKKLLLDTAAKFSDYKDHLRILVIESYGDSELWCDDDLENTIHSVKIPVNIDQIWTADVEWISADDWVIKYRQIEKYIDRKT